MGAGDPQGFLEIMAPDVTYFDPFQERRVDGIDAMRRLLEPLTSRFSISRFEMIAPRVQHHGPVALLTFNLLSYQTSPDGSERVVARWNSTETYAESAGRWQIIHSHWSLITPELKETPSEQRPT